MTWEVSPPPRKPSPVWLDQRYVQDVKTPVGARKAAKGSGRGKVFEAFEPKNGIMFINDGCHHLVNISESK